MTLSATLMCYNLYVKCTNTKDALIIIITDSHNQPHLTITLQGQEFYTLNDREFPFRDYRFTVATNHSTDLLFNRQLSL